MNGPNLFFSTPVWASQISNYKETNDKIYNYIKELQAIDQKGVTKSNIKGWHSKDFDMKNNKVLEFVSLISPKINQVLTDMDWDINTQEVKILNMWSIINTGGASNARHHHGNSDISAAYYVRAPKECGEIVFYDPRPAPVFSHPKSNKSNILNAMVNSITPLEGGLVIFPSYLDHSVNANLSNEERIVISFNIRLIKK
ncbi:2OG-Fe(II) oxygenase family protein [Pelagibacteraceae bacterium]|nr:2OG-Fe(II) oxygenase family protein [Pelagibacteraceae bacterium]